MDHQFIKLCNVENDENKQKEAGIGPYLSNNVNTLIRSIRVAELALSNANFPFR